MMFRLTYAFATDEIYTVCLQSTNNDILSAYESAFNYLEEQHEPSELMAVKALSIMLLDEGEKNAN